MKTKSAILLMAFCSMLWSIAGVIFKYIEFNAFVLAGARSLIAALCVAIFMIITHKKFIFNRVTVTGAIVICSVFICFVGANKLTTAANAIVLQYTAPVFVMLYQVIFEHTKPKLHDVLCVIIVFGGISLFFIDGIGGGTLMGNIVAVISGVAFAGMFVCMSRANPEENINAVFQGQLLTAFIGLPFAFFTENRFDMRTLGLLLILGIIQLGIPYIIVALAGPYCPPLASTLVTVFEPLLNPVWVALIYGEIPGVKSLVGAVIVIITVTLWCASRDAGKRSVAEAEVKIHQ